MIKRKGIKQWSKEGVVGANSNYDMKLCVYYVAVKMVTE